MNRVMIEAHLSTSLLGPRPPAPPWRPLPRCYRDLDKAPLPCGRLKRSTASFQVLLPCGYRRKYVYRATFSTTLSQFPYPVHPKSLRIVLARSSYVFFDATSRPCSAISLPNSRSNRALSIVA